MNQHLHLVSCVRTKLDHAAPASQLYASPWFRKATAYVARRHGSWRVLSAKYGLLAPDDNVSPYELTLNTLCISERRAWAARVVAALEPLFTNLDTVVFLAGARYREFIVPVLEQRGVRVEVPMMGLEFGEQLHWLDEDSRNYESQAK